MDRGGCQFGEKNKKKADDVHLRPTENSVSWHGKIVLALSCLGPLFQFRLELVWTAGRVSSGKKIKKRLMMFI